MAHMIQTEAKSHRRALWEVSSPRRAARLKIAPGVEKRGISDFSLDFYWEHCDPNSSLVPIEWFMGKEGTGQAMASLDEASRGALTSVYHG